MQILHLIGSALPLAILCLMVVLMLRARKFKGSNILAYAIVSVFMFIVLLRT